MKFHIKNTDELKGSSLIFDKLNIRKHNVKLSYIDSRLFENGYEEIGISVFENLTHIVKVYDGTGKRALYKLSDKLDSFWFLASVGKVATEVVAVAYYLEYKNKNICVEEQYELRRAIARRRM